MEILNRSALKLVAFSTAFLLLSACSNQPKESAKTPSPLQQVQASSQLDFALDADPEQLTALCQKALSENLDRLNAIANIKPFLRTFSNTVLAFDTAMADFSDQTSPLTFIGYVSTSPERREAASKCEESVGQHYVAVFTRRDLYEALARRLKLPFNEPSGKEEARLLSETLKGFEKNGLKLSEEDLAVVRGLKQKLSSLETQFSANLNNDVTTVAYSKDELIGVPEDAVNRWKKDANGNYIVSTKSTDYSLIMENAKISETRRKMLSAYSNRAAQENPKLMEEAILLRQQVAKILGYTTWADYRIDGRMAQNTENVLNLLGSLKTKLSERNKKDLAKLLEYIQTEDPAAKELKAWDITYATTQVEKRDYTLDNEVIRTYFPFEKVMAGVFTVYSKLLNVRYVEDTKVKVWAEGVKAYQVVDNQTGAVIAYFYADLIPRDGKYGHAAAFPLISGRQLADGYSVPVASIVANFTPPSDGKPSLLTHDEVETLFHEFGHIMHQILTRAPYASLSGTSVAQDFVEAPSQMLENWVWNEEILRMISGHYETGEALPTDLLQKMLAAQNFNQGYFYTRQIFLGMLDLTFHTTDGPVNTTEVHNKLYKEIIGIDALEGGHWTAGFGHLMGGYDAGYYGYIWSEVYAQDMFTRFEQAGLLNASVGADYRTWILEKGSMLDPLELLTGFLGRAPNDEAFLKKLGL